MPFENFEKGNSSGRNSTASYHTDVILKNWQRKELRWEPEICELGL